MSLFIKTSLLGDGIHHMPALSPSAVCQHPGCGAWNINLPLEVELKPTRLTLGTTVRM
jgi:hypothetical protein